MVSLLVVRRTLARLDKAGSDRSTNAPPCHVPPIHHSHGYAWIEPWNIQPIAWLCSRVDGEHVGVVPITGVNTVGRLCLARVLSGHHVHYRMCCSTLEIQPSPLVRVRGCPKHVGALAVAGENPPVKRSRVMVNHTIDLAPRVSDCGWLGSE